MNPVCILHSLEECKNNATEVKHFTQDTWKKVQSAVKERLAKSNASLSKYFTICYTLPDVLCENVGYHSLCYKNFTAIKKVELVATPHGAKRVLRSDTQHPCTSTSGVTIAKECIFCGRARKKVKGKEVLLGKCDYDGSENSVKTAAMALMDDVMLAKIGYIGFHEEIQYHHECKREYLNKARAVSTNPPQNSHSQAEMKSFKLLVLYIQSSVIDNDRPEFLKSLHRQYCSLLSSEEGRDINQPFTSVQYLGKKYQIFLEITL